MAKISKFWHCINIGIAVIISYLLLKIHFIPIMIIFCKYIKIHKPQIHLSWKRYFNWYETKTICLTNELFNVSIQLQSHVSFYIGRYVLGSASAHYNLCTKLYYSLTKYLHCYKIYYSSASLHLNLVLRIQTNLRTSQ